MLVVMAGLPATGKSTLARALAARLGGVTLDKDLIRAALFPTEDVEYTVAQDDFCMEVMLGTAEYLLRKDPTRVIFLDGRTFSRRYQVERAVAAAERMGTPWRIVECVCAEETARRRLEQDRHHPAANRNWELYQRLRDSFEPIERPRIVISTDAVLAECVAALEKGCR